MIISMHADDNVLRNRAPGHFFRIRMVMLYPSTTCAEILAPGLKHPLRSTACARHRACCTRTARGDSAVTARGFR